MTHKTENIATRIAVMRGEISEAESSLGKRQRDLERLQNEVDHILAGVSFMKERLHLLELSGGEEGGAVSSEFAETPLLDCIKMVIDQNRKPMRLCDITKEILRRGYPALAKKSFTTRVLRSLKRGRDRFTQRGKLWSLNESATDGKAESNAR
jgi:hypothetical protein